MILQATAKGKFEYSFTIVNIIRLTKVGTKALQWTRLGLIIRNK